MALRTWTLQLVEAQAGRPRLGPRLCGPGEPPGPPRRERETAAMSAAGTAEVMD